MVDKLEMSLDDIITTTRRGGRGGRGGGGGRFGRRGASGAAGRGRGGPRRGSGGGRPFRSQRSPRPRAAAPYARGDVNSAWSHDLFDEKRNFRKNSASALVGQSKLMVSNLDFGVSDSDIEELFSEFGPLKSAKIHYDRSGRSLGTADITFERKADAMKAMKQYNGVPLDGRPMKIEMATSEAPSAAPTRFSGGGGGNRDRVASGRVGRRNDNTSFGGGGGGRRRSFSSPRGRGAGGGRGRGGRGGRSKGGKAPTAEELDAELDAYTSKVK